VIRRFCFAIFWAGAGIFVGAYLGLAFTGHQLGLALAREGQAIEAKHEAEARVLAGHLGHGPR
jgi:hypothetical protein